MTSTPDLHCPPLPDAKPMPSMIGSITSVEPRRLESSGHMILEEVQGWLGCVDEKQIIGRWVPDGSDLGELGATMAVAFTVGSTETEAETTYDTFDDQLIADAFFWLDCVQPELSMEDLSAILPWAVSVTYRHPIVGFEEVRTLRSNTGAPWRNGAEIHVTPDVGGRPLCAELTAAFWLKAEVAEGLKWLSEYLSRHGTRTDKPAFETITDGEEARFNQSWWSDALAHYEVFCTLGEDAPETEEPDAAPHYITVRKILRPSEPNMRSEDNPSMEDVLVSIREVISDEDAPQPHGRAASN